MLRGPVFWVLILIAAGAVVALSPLKPRTAPAVAARTALEPRTEFFIIYRNNQPIGYSRATLTSLKTPPGASDPWSIDSEIHLFVVVQDKKIETIQKTTEVINGNLRLLSMKSELMVGDAVYLLDAKTEKSSVFVTTKIGEDELRVEVPYPMGSVPQSAVPLLLAGLNLQDPPSRTLRVMSSAPTRMYLSDMAVTTGGSANYRFDGKVIKITQLNTRVDGIETAYKMDSRGNVYEASQPALGVLQRRVTEQDMAAIKDWLAFDFSKASWLESNQFIKEESNLNWLEAELFWRDGDPENQQLKSDKQQILKKEYESGAARVLVRVSRGSSSEKKQKPLPADKLKPYLESDDKIQTRNASVVNAAKKARGKAKKPFDISKNIARWIFKSIYPDPASWTNDHTAATTLKSRVGMNKHAAILFAAMARSQGVPTRICAGKLYSMGLFVTHFWNEVYVDGRWLTIDATSENPASPAPLRIKLAHAANTDRATAIADSIKETLFIQVRSYEYIKE